MKKELIIIPIFVLTIILVMLIPNNDYIKTGKLYVSEIMASNNYTIKDDDGDYSDYIEIYNGYKNSINLSNYHLSDDEYDTKKWTFPDITIKSNEYIIVYASGKNKCDLETRICHTNFKLSKSGEIITLTDSNGNIINKFSYGNIASDISYGYIKNKYIYMQIPTPGKENNSKRDRKVPEYVIDNQAKKFEIPFANEGFNSIFLHHFPAYNCGALKEEVLLNNITSLMDGFNQKNHHHAYDLGTHCRKLYEELSKRTDDKILLCSALVHDIGKLYTGAPKEDGSGEYSYKQHNNFGAYYLITNLEKIESNRLDEILELLFYVNYHMHPFFVQSGKSEKKWKDIFGEEKYNKLFLFNECDKIASGTHRN